MMIHVGTYPLQTVNIAVQYIMIVYNLPSLKKMRRQGKEKKRNEPISQLISSARIEQ